ncbi:SDR family oxidoreductase [Staphylococcus xylosus]|jgi:NADP-dependent 3-hydroxy acid dehydrogenase YdfG|uniref:Dehydrogenase n=6 Tax=Staphylococcus saprophyticus TaxID=29385 RepID=A0A380HRY9_STASA|nr:MULTISPECIES: SDR family oxidoreductase [Staphylococcus]EHY92186.1 putative dehydrogenase [Staphylococcus saprophyticus subsp. saprophyticus KACC 16562]KIJ85731.1 oxidoreductase [Staphylococcus saprophyticus]MBF2753510.1 SDR family oxidoreductase [Staphylococcus saprophyticus]MBF2780128.1 SDR family oxidoreductase [Staphylococcus saprophyticus]MBF2782778.1 SDR family oxidoreductase [Staphylococcus saprophyticus]
MNNVKDKVVVITGASSGIGEETVNLLSENGAKLVLGARRLDRLEKIQQKVGRDSVSIKKTDVTKADEVNALIETAYNDFGRIDVLINNAGLMPQSFLEKNKQDEWNQMIDVNIKGVLYGIGAVLPYMRKQKSGHIINLASVAGHVVFPGSAVYCGTKYAVRAITEGLRQEEAIVGSNIRTTILSPGAVSTELTDHISDKDMKQDIDELYKNAIKPDAIARAINYAINEPEESSVNEFIIRPSSQSL